MNPVSFNERSIERVKSVEEQRICPINDNGHDKGEHIIRDGVDYSGPGGMVEGRRGIDIMLKAGVVSKIRNIRLVRRHRECRMGRDLCRCEQ